MIKADARRLPLPDNSVACVVTSPPYFGLRRYGDDPLEIGTDTLKGYIADIILAGMEIYRVLGDEDIFWLNIGDTASGSGGAGGDWKNGARAGARKWKQGETGMAPMQWLNIPARVSIALQDPYSIAPIKNETDRAWLAGIVDADGCIGVRRQPGRRENWNDNYTPYITVSMNDKVALDHIADITEMGSVRLKQGAGAAVLGGFNTRHNIYTWRVDGQKAASVIQAIYPHLVIKARQAEVAWTLAQDTASTRGGRRRITANKQANRVRLYEAMKDLNQRWTPDLPALLEPIPAPIHPGWLLRHTLVWEKPRMRPEDLKHTRRPGVSHETVLMFAKTRKHRFYPEGLVEKGSVWHMGTAVKPHHTAAFPLELARRCIACSTEPGDVVLDPFAGSGTTIQAAEGLGRVGIGVDLYCD